MASFKVLVAAACLLVSVVRAMPGGHAESYFSSNAGGGHGFSIGHGGYSFGGSSGGGGYSSGGSSGGKGYSVESYGGSQGYKEETYADHHPKYAFKYGVEDKHTGDYKDAKEERDGDIVHGEYSLLQPDGRKRIVHYTASKHGGFNAQVSYSGHAIHPEQQQHQSHHY